MTWSNGGLHILRANPSGILGGTGVNFYSSGTGNEKIYSEQINAIIQSLASNYIVFTGNKCEPSVSTTDLSSAGTHLAIATGTAFIDNTVVSVSAGSVDLSSAQSGLTTSGQSRYVLVTVNSSGTVVTYTEDVATGGNQTMPEVPEDEALICMVYLDYDTTTFVNNQIADMRIFAPHGQYIDGNSHLADDNKIYFGTSNDSYVSWDNSNLSLALRSNGGLIVTLDDDNNSTNEFRINNGGDTTVVKIDESGNAIFGAVVGSSNTVGTHTNYRQFQIGQATILANSGSASTGDDSWFITNAYYTSDGNFKLKEDGQASKISLGTTGALNHGVSASGSADDTITFSTVFEVNGSGTITSGTWNGSVIDSAYLDSDTAHLTTNQTFTGSKKFNFDGSSTTGSIEVEDKLKFYRHGTGDGSSYIYNSNTGGHLYLYNADEDKGIFAYVGSGGFKVYDEPNDTLRFTVAQDGLVTVENRIFIDNTTDADLSSTDHGLQIGATSGQNLILDNNEILSRSGGATAPLYLQGNGGDVNFGSTTFRMTYDGDTGGLAVKGGGASDPMFSTITGYNTSTPILSITNTVGSTSAGRILRLKYSNDSIVGNEVGVVKYWLEFEDGGGTRVGSVTAEVVYNTFTGAHIGVYSSSTPLEEWRRGMIVCSTGVLSDASTFSNTYVGLDLSNTSKSKTVMGIYDNVNVKHDEHLLNNHRHELESEESGLYKNYYDNEEGERVECLHPHHDKIGLDVDAIVFNAIGEGMILVTNADGDIQNGDYITTSTYAGIGVLQDDDILHSYTVAKCTEQVDWDSVEVDADLGIKVKLVACTYHCG